MANVGGSSRKNSPEFSPVQIQRSLERAYYVIENTRLNLKQAAETQYKEIKYFGERTEESPVIIKCMYDHFYHQPLDFDQKSSRCDRSRPTRFQNSIFEEEKRRIVPVKISSNYGHRKTDLEGKALAFHGRCAATRTFYRRCKVNLQPELDIPVA